MPSNSIITICIPIYRYPNVYLQAAIKSVLKQTVDAWHMLIVDGCNTANTELQEMVGQLNHANVSYVRNNVDKSMAGNWNFAIEQANTELVTLLHDDDVLAPNYVEKMLAFANKFPNSAAYYCDVNLIDEVGKETWSVADKVKSLIKPKAKENHISGDSGLASLLRGCYIFCPTMCYRKDLLPEKLFSNQWQMVADFQCYYDLLINGLTISGTSQKLYNYRRHNNNQTAKLTSNLKRFEEEVRLYQSVHVGVKNSWPMSAFVAKKKRIIKLHLLFLMSTSLCKLDFNYFKTLYKFYKNNT